ncbi:DNA polymerase III subunit [Algoriphagus chordae]|uniref:DNA polymerase-3 subunit delta n=1 Tax=Algoriphagus chordae TaxID=237019 RepID=A0A2W7QQC0_9BACT|nr:DNA polymerase III subunit [Algoriphagus chordae]PZX50211.1 DNA polymerase-3 subunit delta' [Algoriphagus chordae]
MQFADIPGLPETKENLINAVKHNHLAHALLFHGPEGSANLTMALALCTYLYCEKPSDTDSCGVCSSCQRMSRLLMPDLNFAMPAITTTKDDEEDKPDLLANWRKFVIEQPYGNVHDFIYFNNFEKKQLNISKGAARRIIQSLSLMSFEGGYKIMMIWAPEFLHPAAANALLKILEEPQPKTLFILVTSHADQLLTTILSRTQKVTIRGFSDEEVKNHLVAEDLCIEASAEQIAMLADGNLREAYRLVDQVEDLQVKKIREWFLSCYKADFKSIFGLADDFHKSDKEAQKSLVLTGLNVLREILLKNAGLDDLLRTHDEDRDFVNKISGNILKEEHVGKLYGDFNMAHYHLERNGNAKFIFTDLSMNVTRLMAKIS